MTQPKYITNIDKIKEISEVERARLKQITN